MGAGDETGRPAEELVVSRDAQHEEQEAEIVRSGADVHTDPTPDEREALVLECLDALEPNQRQVVLLRLQQGMSYEEIGEITGQSVGYVGNLLHFAVKRLAVEVRRREERRKS
jgi:RNA polymerase sigma-70 factor (ECF subfamily)